MSPRVFVVAGEEFGDRLGAALIAALKRAVGSSLQLSGVGGAQMATEGVVSPFPLGDLALMGFVALPASLPRILRRIHETADAVIAAMPDVLVIVDSPEFTHRVARRVRARLPTLPIVDYVCPSVWAWRPGRARAMTAYVNHVLALLPFEPEAMRRLGGPSTTYVGHPLTERAATLRPNAEEARRRDSEPPVLLVMPGSRSGEVSRMAGIFGEAVGLLAKDHALDVVVPAVPRLVGAIRAAVERWPVPARIVVEQADKDAAFRVARAALVKSGTSTLEVAIAGVPMVTAYKVPLFEEMIARALITAPSAILANLVLGENVIPEFLQRQCNPAALAAALRPLMAEGEARRRQIDAFSKLDTIMEIGSASPSDRAAAVVLAHAAGTGRA